MLKLVIFVSIFLFSVSGDEWQGISQHQTDNSDDNFSKSEILDDRSPDKNEEAPCATRRSAGADGLAHNSQWFRPPALKWRSVHPIDSKDKITPTFLTTTIKPQPAILKQELHEHQNQVKFTIALPQDHRPPQQGHQITKPVDIDEFNAYADHLMNYLSKDTLPVFDPKSMTKPKIAHTEEFKPAKIEDDRHRPSETQCLLHADGLYNTARRSLPSNLQPILSVPINNSPFYKPKELSDQNINTSDKNGNKNETEKNIADTVENEANRRALIYTPTSRNYFVKTKYAPRPAEKNQLLEPTKGVGISPMTSSNYRSLAISRVCYACSTSHDPSCLSPDRGTSVKYCGPGRDTCVTRQYKNITDGVSVAIRDCSSVCKSTDLGELKYKSCSICIEDLCNIQPLDNSSSSKQQNILLIGFIIGFATYLL